MSEEKKVEGSFFLSPSGICTMVFLSGVLMGMGSTAAYLGGTSPLVGTAAGKDLMVGGWIAGIGALLCQIPLTYLVAQLRRKD